MQALEDMVVLDLTQYLSGPYCTMMLGDLGADVLKIEKPANGDDQRRLEPHINGEGSPFMMINRNKRSITLDLKSTPGREIFLQLAAGADVVIENFRPGVVDSLGIGYEAVKEVNPGIVYCSISGYGQTGAYKHKGGFDIMAQGMTGMMHLNTPAGKSPVKMPVSIHDIGAGLTALYSILAAYICRQRTGLGQFIDVSLVESGLAFTVQEASAYFVNGVAPKSVGTRNHLSAPYQAFRTKDGYVIVGASNQKLWESFCRRVVEKPEWIEDSRFLKGNTRVQNVDVLEELIEEILVLENTAHWVSKLDEAGIPGGPIHSLEDALEDPYFIGRKMVIEMDHPRAGRIRTLGIPSKMSGTPGKVRLPPPVLGQHTDEVLKQLLSFTDDELSELRSQRITAS